MGNCRSSSNGASRAPTTNATTIIEQKPTKKLVMFDFDGTIADSVDFLITKFNEKLQGFGQPPIPAEIQRSVHARELVKGLNSFLSKDEVTTFVTEMRTLVNDSASQHKAYAGAVEAVKKIKDKGNIVGIITSSNKSLVAEFCAHNGMDFLDFIKQEENFWGKGDMMKAMIQEYDVAPENAFYVGDEARDCEECSRVGVQMIACTWGYNDEALLNNYKPKFMVHDFQQLLAIFGE
jgi:phosphoglycolate phosphatase-like HAD superfamily hydrolase